MNAAARRALGLCWCAALLCLFGAGSALGDDALRDRLLRSTGWVRVPTAKRDFYHDGTCWVVDAKRRLAVTNAHVVGDTKNVTVSFPLYDADGKVISDASVHVRQEQPIAAEVVSKDTKRDLALMRLKSLPMGIEAIPMAAESAKTKQRVATLGNPHPAGVPFRDIKLWRYSEGTTRTVCFNLDLRHDEIEYQIEARQLLAEGMHLSHGNSGGAVVDDKGRLVAVVTGSDEKEGIDHAIDVSDVRIFLQRADGERPFEKKGMPIVGLWTVTVGRKNMGLTLREDGSCVVENVDGSYPGQYAYKNSTLSLNVPERKIRASWPIRWVDDNSFTCVERGTTLTFTRR